MFFIIKESLKDLKRTLFSSLLTISLIFISLFIANLYYMGKNNLENVIEKLKSEFEIEIFLVLDVEEKEVQEFITSLKNKEEVKAVTFISKEKALELFKKEFNDDPIKTIGYNPLPQSLKITINENYTNKETISSFIENYLSNGKYKEIIDEIHFENFLDILEVFKRNVNKIGLILFASISILTILLIFNNIRLTIKYKEEIIRTMKLVGASNYMIRMPFIFGGILMGSIAAGLSVISIEYSISFINKILSNYSILPSISNNGISIIRNIVIKDYYMIFLFGITIGIIGSWASVNKYLTKY